MNSKDYKPLKEKFVFEEAKIGDLFSETVVDDFMNCLPPASYSASCAQLGEPYSHRLDRDTNTWKATYITFKKVKNGIWEYCGTCFHRKTVHIE